jgi:hypothetical protein
MRNMPFGFMPENAPHAEPAFELVDHLRGGRTRQPDVVGGLREAATLDHAREQNLAGAIVNVVNMPFGKRPFRVHIDPSLDGADVGFAVLDRVRAEMLHRVGLSDLLKPRTQI